MSVLRTYIFFTFLMVLVSCSGRKPESTELLFWCSNNNKEIELCKEITDQWNQSNSVHKVHIQPVPEGQSSEEVILAAVVGETTPDIYANMWQGNVEMYAKAGVLVPLDTLEGFMSFIQERCDPAVIKEITSADGHIYQVPWKVNPFMAIYNKDLLAANSINEIPTTYDSYLQSAEKFKRNNENGVSRKWFGYTEVKEIWYQRLFNFYPLYLAASNGGSLIVDNRAAFNNADAIAVFDFMQKLYRNNYYPRENLAANSDPFVSQTIVTKFTGPWETNYLLGFPDRHFDFEYFAPPVPANHQGPVYTYADPKNIVVFKTCKFPQQAWNFIKTLVNQQGDLRLLTLTGQLPRRKNLYKDPFYKSFFIANPLQVPFAKQVDYVKGVDNCEDIVAVLDIISQEYTACVIYGRKTPERAIADAAAAVNVLLIGKESKAQPNQSELK